MNAKLIAAVAGILTASISMSANANITYNYTTQPLIEAHGTSYEPGHATLVLNDNGTELLDWSFYQPELGSLTMEEASHLFDRGWAFPAYFFFKTDSSGNVTDWRLTGTAIFGSILLLADRAYFDFAHLYNGSLSYDRISHLPPEAEGIYAVSLSPGIWISDTPLANISINTAFFALPDIPEPSTYAMLLAGLGLMGFSLKHQTKSTRVNA